MRSLQGMLSCVRPKQDHQFKAMDSRTNPFEGKGDDTIMPSLVLEMMEHHFKGREMYARLAPTLGKTRDNLRPPKKPPNQAMKHARNKRTKRLRNSF